MPRPLPEYLGLIIENGKRWHIYSDGTRLPYIGGGSDDADGDDTDGGSSSTADDKPDGADDLGDKGKKALDEMKAKWHKERDDRKAVAAELAATKAELEALKKPADGDSKDAPDVETIRREVEESVTASANARVVRAEIKAAATGKLADPADALAFLDATKFEVDADGNVDEDKIAEAITDLLTKKPHLAAQDGKWGDADGGARKETPKRAASLEEAVHKKLSPNT